jgi:hypothetical protein
MLQWSEVGDATLVCEYARSGCTKEARQSSFDNISLSTLHQTIVGLFGEIDGTFV